MTSCAPPCIRVPDLANNTATAVSRRTGCWNGEPMNRYQTENWPAKRGKQMGVALCDIPPGMTAVCIAGRIVVP